MNILIVEDSSSVRNFIAAILENDLGADIVQAANGMEAMKVLPQHRFDVILTDINMPEINGLELISFLKRHPAYQAIPVVIISTEASRQDRERGLELGATAYITKPFNEQLLADEVRQIVEAVC